MTPAVHVVGAGFSMPAWVIVLMVLLVITITFAIGYYKYYQSHKESGPPGGDVPDMTTMVMKDDYDDAISIQDADIQVFDPSGRSLASSIG